MVKKLDFIGLVLFFITLISLAIALFFLGSYLAKKVFTPEKVRKNLNIIIGLLLVIAFVDFLLGAVFTFPDSLSTDLLILIGSFLLAIVTVPILFSLRAVYPFDIAKKSQVRSILSIALSLVIISQILVCLTYVYEILALTGDIQMLIGFKQIFNPSTTLLLPDVSENDPNFVLLFLIFFMRSILLLTHHLAIVFGFLGALMIFNEWGVAMRDPIIGFFKLFSYGYLLQALGQIIVGILLILYSTTGQVGALIVDIEFVGGSLSIAGTIIYYIAFAIASLNLLKNIEHLVFPQRLIDILKVTSILIPSIYSVLYIFTLIGSVFGYTTGDYSFTDTITELTHVTDFLGIWLVPLAAGLFFLAAYIRSKEKPHVTFSSFLILGFFAIMMLFYSGNNTLTLISWNGLTHGQLGIIGILLLIYSLSRVAEHASRHRQVITKIRENPDDFMFLAELGKSERKIQAWQKIDAMSKEGIIKPLTPVIDKKDETKLAAEVNSYMAEIEAIRKRRAAKRARAQTS